MVREGMKMKGFIRFLQISESGLIHAPTQSQASDFANPQRLQRLPDCFPELAGETVCGAVASVYLDPSIVAFLNREHLFGIAMGDEVMEVMNLGQF